VSSDEVIPDAVLSHGLISGYPLLAASDVRAGVDIGDGTLGTLEAGGVSVTIRVYSGVIR
jgi:hypothetical protein